MRRRSTPAAVLLTVLVVLAAAVIVIVVAAVANTLAGRGAAAVAAIAAEIAVLSFVTRRAYPPGVKRPMLMFMVLTLLISALFPLIYLSWLWVTKKKWREVGLEDDEASSPMTGYPPSPPKSIALVADAAPMAADDEEGYKTCPDCAEQIRAGARVCRYCGYR